ncbi:hypothetical protein J7T55_005232 [Diaporthe amygdali]|uniref:uncharacterized protein n=1 Tax=Phomopsis amygdali TaxID=1214568 RepID=UPI0022FF04C2|nr:uncharacterized protein J7T55_005232 [Diaporthe amygdali]KAJ0116286.1 hypothetical protein J7T55_005232 [Diaporthe amygdali]
MKAKFDHVGKCIWGQGSGEEIFKYRLGRPAKIQDPDLDSLSTVSHAADAHGSTLAFRFMNDPNSGQNILSSYGSGMAQRLGEISFDMIQRCSFNDITMEDGSSVWMD